MKQLLALLTFCIASFAQTSQITVNAYGGGQVNLSVGGSEISSQFVSCTRGTSPCSNTASETTGASITLSEMPNNPDPSGLVFVFGEWTGPVTSTASSYTFTLSANTTVNAYFYQQTPPSLFGEHYNHSTTIYPPVAPMTFGLIRLWDTETGWGDLQAGPNCTNTATSDCNFTRLQQWLNKFPSSVPIILTLAKTPNFIAVSCGPGSTQTNCASGGTYPQDANCGYAQTLGSPNGSCTPPSDINCNGTGTDATWIQFITALWNWIGANGYTGRIWGLEIWNEWDVAEFWDGGYIANTACIGVTHAQQEMLVRFEQDARCVVVSAAACNSAGTYPKTAMEPAVHILSPPLPGPGASNAAFISGGEEDVLLSLGGGSYADDISMHGYVENFAQATPNCASGSGNSGCAWPENIQSGLAALATLEGNYSLSLPIVVSEGSEGAQSNVTDNQFVQAFIPRYYALMAQYGALAFAWYNVDGGLIYSTFANNATGALSVGGAAQQTIQAWLNNKSFVNSSCTVTARSDCSGGSGYSVHSCALNTGEELLWYDSLADNASCTVTGLTGFGTYQTVAGSTNAVAGNAVTLDNRVILLSPAGPAPPTGLFAMDGEDASSILASQL